MNEVSTWKLRAWFHSPRTNCFLSPFIESDFLLKSSSPGNDSEKIATFTNVSVWGVEFFSRLHIYCTATGVQAAIIGVRRPLHALRCVGMLWLLQSFEIWTAILRHRPSRSGFPLADRRDPGFRSPTVMLRVSARRPSRSGFPLADRRDPGFRSPTAAIRVSTRRRPAKGQLWEPNQTRSMVQRIFWSSLQEFDLVHPGSLGKLSPDQTPAKLVFKFAVMLLTYPSNGSQQDWPQHCISNYSY